MPGTLAAIGLGSASDDELIGMVAPLVASATRQLAVGPGDYGIWRSASGAELWFHIEGRRDADGELEDPTAIGFAPFFSGESEARLRVGGLLRREGDNPFEGALEAELIGDAGGAAGGLPVVLDLVDWAAHADLAAGEQVRARIVGLAMELSVYPDEAQFQADWPGEAKFAARSLIPIGVLGRIDDQGRHGETPPSSNAVVNGTVRDYARLVNEATGQSFLWLLVESRNAIVDILADPAIVAGEIAEGAVVSAGCRLLGRIVER